MIANNRGSFRASSGRTACGFFSRVFGKAASRSAFHLALALATIGSVAGFVESTGAVNLSSNGLGQVLIFPYYTVNAHQQTLISVVNTTHVGKVVKVRFREAYNGRAVLDFNLYLSPLDVWTANVFALSDASVNSDLAAIFTTDKSCTVPRMSQSGILPNGFEYQNFSTGNYTGANADTGPSVDSRVREGHIEMILMSDILPGSSLATATTHVNSVPPGCASVAAGTVTGYGRPTADPATGNPGALADGGLFGSASIVDVANGVFYAYTADALDGFSYISLFSPLTDVDPTLAAVNDRNNAHAATAHVVVNGEPINSTFPGAAGGSRAVDAVSAVFAANNIQNEYVYAVNGAIGTDWVVTLPTKHLYVDAQPGGAIAGTSSAYAPFEQLFGGHDAGRACIAVPKEDVHFFDREENTVFSTICVFEPCPIVDTTSRLCLETNVIAFSAVPSDAGLSVLGTQLSAPNNVVKVISSGGWLNLDLSQSLHQLYAASNGNVFHGVPVTGFAAVRYVSNYVPIAGGGVAIANYTGTYRHRDSAVCTNINGPCR